MGWDNQDDKERKKGGPWGNRDSDRRKKPSPAQDIPDLDAFLNQAQSRFGNFMGAAPPSSGKKGVFFVLALVFVLWLATGFYRVLPEENAVLLTFGKWTSTRSESGLGYHIPWPVQSVTKVNVAFDRRVEIGFRGEPPSRATRTSTASMDVASESRMLTGDENIVSINFVVMWRIGDAKKYLFQIREPEVTVKKVSESAMREIIGHSLIQKALTEGRAEIEASTKDLMQKMLDDYQSGIVVNSVQLLSVNPPDTVVDAFDDVQRARADKERAKNEAETYRNDIVPRARGEAQKLVQDAEAYKEAVISKAKGEAARFLSVYAAYAQAKDVTLRRIYVETMQQIMQNSKKVILNEGRNGQILPYLPLDQLQGRPKTPAMQ